MKTKKHKSNSEDEESEFAETKQDDAPKKKVAIKDLDEECDLYPDVTQW
jgi:hypothetical protein